MGGGQAPGARMLPAIVMAWHDTATVADGIGVMRGEPTHHRWAGGRVSGPVEVHERLVVGLRFEEKV